MLGLFILNSRDALSKTYLSTSDSILLFTFLLYLEYCCFESDPWFAGANSFDEITEDRKVAKTLKSLYTSVDNLDLYVAGLAEDHLRGSELGPTFQKIFMDQWKRIRDGDRFWYTRVLSKKVF